MKILQLLLIASCLLYTIQSKYFFSHYHQFYLEFIKRLIFLYHVLGLTVEPQENEFDELSNDQEDSVEINTTAEEESDEDEENDQDNDKVPSSYSK